MHPYRETVYLPPGEARSASFPPTLASA